MEKYFLPDPPNHAYTNQQDTELIASHRKTRKLTPSLASSLNY